MHVNVCVCFSMNLCVSIDYVWLYYARILSKGVSQGYEIWFLLLYLVKRVSHQWFPKLTTQRVTSEYRCRDCCDTHPVKCK